MNGAEPAAKRAKLAENGDKQPGSPKLRELAEEVEHFASILSEAID